MPLQPTTLLIPEVIDIGLKKGELIRDGSVVRNTAGQFVKHLVEVPTKPSVAEKALELVRVATGRPPVVVCAVGLTALTAVGVTVAVSMSKKDAEEAKSKKHVDANEQHGLAKNPPPAPDGFTDDIVVDLNQHLAAQRERLRRTE